MGVNREWLKYIDLNLIDIYPIQFANCERLQNNDAVYIFDEVGSGKTISSGLMALDYLYNNPDKNVLIVTTNALYKRGTFEYGQFLKDWYGKLPFKELGLIDRVEIKNNHYSNLKPDKYGLIIVDEAQLFLNKESLRYQCLSKIKADKIVILTATPIKTSKIDLYTYVELAENILGKALQRGWIDEIDTKGKSANEIICSTFDAKFPVTRYFKDTIMSLSIEGYQKRQARRLTPELWEYDTNTSKDKIFIQKILDKYNLDNKNKFVVFTRFVKKEAVAIGELLKNNGFSEFNSQTSELEKTFKVVTGENGCELSNYEKTSNLPTVLILTYQIAEQGVNLPGYNHVVNYHISAFPSALEQRFGRIDRMGKNGSQYSEINMCFLISKSSWDTNTLNFYYAVNTYLHNLISYLPSKNTILSTNIIHKYGETREYVKKYIDRIEKLLDDDKQLSNIYEYFYELAYGECEDNSLIECQCDKELFQFIDEYGIEPNMQIEKIAAINEFKKEIRQLLNEFANEILGKEELPIEKYETLFRSIIDNESVSDKIFYSDDENYVNIKTVDAISECAEKYISGSNTLFNDFRIKFRDKVRLPVVVSNYWEKINSYFEQKFMSNEFILIFPYEGYTDIFNEILSDISSKEDRDLLVENSDIIVKILPVFKVFRMYGDILKNLVYTQKKDIMCRFDFNQFSTAIYQVSLKVKSDKNRMGLSEIFFNKYFKKEDWNFSDFYKINYPQNNNECVEASNWYKLAYHYTRKEEACFIRKSTLCIDVGDNFYRKKEELIKFLASNYDKYKQALELWNEACDEYYDAYKVAMDGETDDFNPKEILEDMGFYGEPERPNIVDEYEDAEIQLHEILKRRDLERQLHQSLFNHFIFTDAGNYRTYSQSIYAQGCWKIKILDWWTQGILNDIYGWRNSEITLGQVTKYKLPEEFAKVSIY